MSINSFFNNFSLNLGPRREKLEQVEHELGKEKSILDKKIYSQELGASQKKQQQTPREFHDEIDSTIKELGLDKDELGSLHNRCREKRDFTEFAENEAVFNLYVRLRAKGYNHYPDLTS